MNRALLLPLCLLCSLTATVCFAPPTPTRDFGDAPDSYQTLQTSGGPRHLVDAIDGPYLGSTVDADDDGVPTLDASGDGADEDCLADGFLPYQIGVAPVINIIVNNRTGSDCTVFGWIDYDGSGEFDMTERASAIVPDGSTNAVIPVTFPIVPANSVSQTYARFRISGANNVDQPGGNDASSGEVEDYGAGIPDNSAPSTTSFERNSPATSPTNADTLVFRVTFSEDVASVDLADFAVSGTTATVSNVNQVSADVYDVTVSGGDLAGLDGTVGLDLAGGQNITDLAGNALPNTEPGTDQTYLVDNSAPSTPVADLQAASDTGTSDSDDITNDTTPTIEISTEPGATVEWFIDGVSQGTTTADGGGVATFTPSSDLAPGTYAFTAQSTDDAGNTSAASNALNVTIDTAAPSTTSFERNTPATSPTNADTLVFRVTFSEDVASVDLADFAVSGTTATVSNVNQVSADVYDVTVSGGDLAGLDGTVGLDLAGGQNITDLAGNALPNTEPGTDQTYLVDNSAPSTPVADLQAASDTGTSDSDDITNDTTPTIEISTEPGATVEWFIDGVSQGTTTADGGGVATFTPSSDLAPGTYAFTAQSTDDAGNTSAASNALNVTIDTAAPSTTSFERNTPATSPTNADTLVFRVTFSEDVASVDLADFAVSATTATVSNVNQVSAAVYDVTVSGGDLAGLDGTVGLNLAGGQNITDLAGNALPNTEPGTDQTYLVDNSAPSTPVADLQAASDTGTSDSDDITNDTTPTIEISTEPGATVEWFIDGVSQGTTTADGGGVATFTPSSDLAPGTYAFTAQSTDDAGNTSAASNALNVTIDTAAPSTTSFERNTPATSPTNADTLVFRVTFSEDVASVDLADFAVSATTATVSNVNQVSAAVYDVTVSGGDLAGLDGTVGLNLAGGQNITDLAGNALPNTEPGTDQTYLVDNSAPSTPVADLQAASDTGTSDSDDITNDTTPTIEISTEPGATVEWFIDGVSQGTTTADGGGVATFTPSSDLAPGTYAFTAQSTDDAGNTSAASNALNVTIDTAAPSTTSFERNTPATSPTNADTLVFRVTFSEDVASVDLADFAVSATTATVSNVNQVSADVYDVTVSGGDLAGLDGTVGLNLAGGQNITDLAGNALPNTEPGTDQTYLVDNSAPSTPVADLQAASDTGTSDSDDITNDTTPTIEISTEPGATVEWFIDGVSQGTTTADGGGVATFTPSSDLAPGTYAFTAQSTDDAGNTSAASNALNVTIDTAAPSTTSFERNTPATSPTNADTLVFRVTFSEDVASVDPADFAVSATTATVSNVNQVSAAVYDVTVSGGDLAGLDGTVGLNLAGGQNITDLAGNALPNTEPGTDQTYLVDNSAPSTPVADLQAASDTGTSDSDDITNDTTPTIEISTEPGATVEWFIDGVSQGTTTADGGGVATFTPSSDLAPGTYAFTAQSTDDAGNTSAASNALNVTIDTAAPSTTSFERNTPATSPTNADTLVFRVTFSEDVASVDLADFAVSATTATVSNVNQVSAAVYDVTVSGGDLAGLDGTVGLDLAGGQNITDLAGNALPNTEPGTDQTYLVDNSAPSTPVADLQAASDTGTSDSDDITNDTTPTIEISTEPGATVEWFIDGVSQGTTTADGGGVATFTPSSDLAPGTYAFTAQSTDDAGNTSAASNALNVTIDTAAPSTTSFERNTPATSPTNADTLVFRVTFSEDVASVDLADFAVSATTATVSNVNQVSAAVYDVTVSGGDLAGLDGTVGLDLAGGQNITDLAGNALPNTEPGTDQTYLVDNSAPSTPVADLQAASDTGTSDSDDITNDTTPTIEISTEPGATVEWFIDGVSQGTTTADGGGVATFTPSSDLAPGTYAFTAQSTDDAGNTSAASNALNVTIDTAAPSTTSFERNTPATSPTNADTLVFRVTFSEDVASVDPSGLRCQWNHRDRIQREPGLGRCLRRYRFWRRPRRAGRHRGSRSGRRAKHHRPSWQCAAEY